MTHWILIADAADAKIYAIKGRNQPLSLVQEVRNAAGRARTQELVTDEPGRGMHPGAPGMRSAMEPQTTAHDDARNRFVRELSQLLRTHFEKGAFASLSLVAPAHLLGQLRDALDKNVARVVKSSSPRDLTRLGEHELMPHLEPLLVPELFVS